ncbi:MAG TPA: SLBB domain-containing protein [Rhodocyclaceae bacterium]|nr:SLBB domain-containing protein [Rhodocyclaceae bacterium]HNE41797.1 SLBB domain-containing protein [Rhodocyclaceae bacterium]HNL20406.1 SLBB domain-containing protein [Rhodocyclaceae bacterium]HNM20860.1 SLBB domain-containing protein [Rhodocyclaceae bacterium]HNM80020.1 SLBB domain-containing protein [Rhodocyclaceae bacterium]
MDRKIAVPGSPSGGDMGTDSAGLMPPTAPQLADYAANRGSDVFGANLFTGSFARQGALRFNQDYAVMLGDKIQFRLWGGFEFDGMLVVDPKGNIFIPHVGPVSVLGVRNNDLQRTVESAVRKVFRANVFCYASLAAAQPVRVFVGGYVNRPGLYNGTSLDSVLSYLDQAGGIDPGRGSFLNVQVKRGDMVRATLNLYDFMLYGQIPLVQLSEGDVILVQARQNGIRVSGLVANAKQFEFSDQSRTVADLISLAKPFPSANHVRIVRNSDKLKNVEYFPLTEASRVAIQNGDELEFTSDKKPGTITVRVEGEHQSNQEFVLPYGARLGDLLARIQYSERSEQGSLQLFRVSVRERQTQLLKTSLRSLETAALTARSGTSDEARLRKDEADLILQWIERAKKIEGVGQVIIAKSDSKESLLLENGDVIRIPVKDGLVLVGGEVLFPTAIAYQRNLVLEDYIRLAGGFTQNADGSRVVVAKQDGSFSEANADSSGFSLSSGELVQPGDQVLVLPRIDVKSRQIWKDLTQIIYQIAVSAKVVLGL